MLFWLARILREDYGVWGGAFMYVCVWVECIGALTYL